MDWQNFSEAMLMLWILKNNHKQPESNMPPLESYQQEAIEFVIKNWDRKINTLCALDVGMGKTRIACDILSRLLNEDSAKRLQGYTLICCPTIGLIETIWSNTLTEYNLVPKILEGGLFRRMKMESKKVLTVPPLNAYLITYANLIKNDNIEYFINTPPNLIIFDEYHTLTNNSPNENQKYRETMSKLPIRLRLGLTATPFVNNEMESIFAYGFLNDAALIEKFYSIDRVHKASITQRIKKKKFLFYKDNPYNLTKSSEFLISIPMGRELYSKYLIVKEKYKYNHMKTIHQIGKLSISPTLLENSPELGAMQHIETGKMKAIKSIIKHLPAGDKIVICDNYKETLDFIIKLDFIRPLKPVLYIGGKKSNNKKNIECFNNQPDCRILLTTRQEGGEGLNLQVANHLVLLNCWYTAKDIIQILGRIKRKGQRKPVYSYILGYNLFECLEPGKDPKSYILQEDEGFYKMIKQKAEMCEEWGIKVKTKLPKMISFFNFSSFENDFTNFLNTIAIKETPKLSTDDLSDEINKHNKKYSDGESIKQAFFENEKEMGETYMMYIFSQYMNYLKTLHSKENKQEKKVILKKKKHSQKIKNISYEDFLKKIHNEQGSMPKTKDS